MNFTNSAFLIILPFIISSIGCLVLIQLSNRKGFVEDIKEDRWHTGNVAKFGGVAIYLGTVLSISFFISGLNDFYIILGIMGSVAFLLGLYDDIKGIFPSLKMLVFVCFAILCFNFNIRIFSSYEIYISLPFTILWITGIINAINIIDNMDGLSSGVSSIILASFSLMAFSQNNETIFIISMSLLGACLGFLVFNFSPAKIFMGDSGSLFIGLILSILSLEISGNETNIFATLLVPTLLLAFPIFDTTLVTINRILDKTPVSRGGVDHTSHRLVGIGLSEKKTVLFLYFISACFCCIVLLFQNHGYRTWFLIFIMTSLGLGVTGLFLSYYYNNEPKLLHNNLNDANYVFKAIVQYKKQILEVLFDSLIVVFSFSLSHYLRYENRIPKDIWLTHDDVIGWVVFIKVITFYYFGLYRGVWKYASLPDILNAFKAIFTAQILIIVFIVFVFGEYSFSRSIFFIDFIISFIFISFFRVFYRIFSEVINSVQPNRDGEKIILIGAGILSQLVLRKILDNDSKELLYPVGILDDKPSFKGRMIFGVPILGKIEEFKKFAKNNNVSKVFITKSDYNSDSIVSFCEKNNIEVRHIKINI